MKQLGVTGYPLDHSYSPSWFARRFREEGRTDWHYDPFPVEQAEHIPRLFEQHPLLVGLNVTLPYKEEVVAWMDTLTPAARRVGAVNTIRKELDGRLTGHNTDVLALETMFSERNDPPRQALILGTGGASKAVGRALEGLAVRPTWVSRTARSQNRIWTYGELNTDHLQQYPWIINTTPLGMHPQVDALPPLPYEGVGSSHWLLDLIYNPEQTRFLQEGAQQGAQTENGLRMLAMQAAYSWQFFLEVYGLEEA